MICTPHPVYCAGDKIEKNEMDWAYSVVCINTCPRDAIQCFLLQFPVTPPVLNIIQQTLRYTSSSSRHFYTSVYLTLNKVFQKTVPTLDVTNPSSILSISIVFWIFHFPLLLTNTLSFVTRSVQLISIVLRRHISKLCVYVWSSLRSVQVSTPYTGMLQMQHFTSFLLKFKSNLLVKRILFFLNAALAKAILGILSTYASSGCINIFDTYKVNFISCHVT